MRSGRNDLGGQQTGRPEHNEMSAAPKFLPAGKSFGGATREADPFYSRGRPTTQGKKQACAPCGTAGVGDQASQEGFAEITSGRSHSQQGLDTTCKDFSNEASPKERRGRWDWRMSP